MTKNDYSADLHIIGSSDDPVLPGDEHGGPDGQVADLERLDELLGVEVPDVDVAIVKGNQHPLLGRVQVAGLDPVRPGGQLALYVQF